MTIPATSAEAKTLIEQMVPDHSSVTICSVDVAPWGVSVSFDLEGIAIDHGEILSTGSASAIYVGEEEFVQSHAVRIDVEGDDGDDEDGPTPAAILVGIHTSGQYSDEDYEAGYSGTMLILAKDGDEDQWRDAADAAENTVMRRCVNDALAQLEKIVAATRDEALAGFAKEEAMRTIMRRAAIVA